MRYKRVMRDVPGRTFFTPAEMINAQTASPALHGLDVKPVREWCEDQFGKPDGARYAWNGAIIWFTNEVDALAFMMRWG